MSVALVLIQFACLGVLAATGPWVTRAPALLAAEMLGGAIALWGIVSIRYQDLSVFPDVRDGASFVRRGPYQYIRHPMYAGLLLATAAVVADAPSTLRICMWLTLLADILVKMVHEERLLMIAYAEYGVYRHGTWRLVPLLY